MATIQDKNQYKSIRTILMEMNLQQVLKYRDLANQIPPQIQKYKSLTDKPSISKSRKKHSALLSSFLTPFLKGDRYFQEQQDDDASLAPQDILRKKKQQQQQQQQQQDAEDNTTPKAQQPQQQQQQQQQQPLLPDEIRKQYHDIMGTAGQAIPSTTPKATSQPSTSIWDKANWHYPWSSYWDDKKVFPPNYVSPSQPKVSPQWANTPDWMKKLPGAETVAGGFKAAGEKVSDTIAATGGAINQKLKDTGAADAIEKYGPTAAFAAGAVGIQALANRFGLGGGKISGGNPQGFLHPNLSPLEQNPLQKPNTPQVSAMTAANDKADSQNALNDIKQKAANKSQILARIRNLVP
jgi:hypothetical protein